MQLKFNNNFFLIKDKIINKFKNLKLNEWLNFVGIFIFLVSLGFSIYDFVHYLIPLVPFDQAHPEKIWFGVIDKFTYQSNWILLIYSIFYFLFPKHQILKSEKFFISALVYIFFTFIGFNVILVGLSNNSGYTGLPVDIALNAWTHVIAPIYFFIFGFIKMYQTNFKKEYKYLSFFLKGMIYPTIYGIYICTIPFVLTNWQEPNSSLPPGSYSVYGDATNTAENPLSWAYICGMYFVFFPLSYALFFYSWKLITKQKYKKNKSIYS